MFIFILYTFLYKFITIFHSSEFYLWFLLSKTNHCLRFCTFILIFCTDYCKSLCFLSTGCHNLYTLTFINLHLDIHGCLNRSLPCERYFSFELIRYKLTTRLKYVLLFIFKMLLLSHKICLLFTINILLINTKQVICQFENYISIGQKLLVNIL